MTVALMGKSALTVGELTRLTALREKVFFKERAFKGIVPTWSNGRTFDFDSKGPGSNPGVGASFKEFSPEYEIHSLLKGFTQVY